MSANANTNKTPTPVQALNVLIQIAQHPKLELNFQDHVTVQTCLQVLKALVEPVPVPASAAEAPAPGRCQILRRDETPYMGPTPVVQDPIASGIPAQAPESEDVPF